MTPETMADFRPMSLARRFIGLFEKRTGRTLHFRDHFLSHGANGPRQIFSDEIRASLWLFLDKQVINGVRYFPTRRRVSDVLDATKAVTQVFESNPPEWMRVRPVAAEKKVS